MTEAEWLAATDPTPMLEFLRGKASDRKLRLLACGVCRRHWSLLVDDRSRRAVELSELYADGGIPIQELGTASQLAGDYALYAEHGDEAGSLGSRLAWYAYMTTAPADAASEATIPAADTGLVRCIFGPLLYRSVTPDPSWLTSTVVSLAQTIYAERAFDRLPILSDALEDAGCDNEDILSHLRGDGPHVRGCWAVDLILGKG